MTVIASPAYVDLVYRSTNLDTLALPAPFEVVLQGDTLSAPVSSVGAPAESPLALTPGGFGLSPADAFYERIYLSDTYENVGVVITTATRTFKVWNAYRFTPKAFTSWLGTNDLGITKSTLTPPPYTMEPLEEAEFTLSVSPDGPPQIQATFTWVIDGQSYTVDIEGSRRVILFPFSPDWKTPVTETLEWKTDIFRAYAGDEQRISLRTKPRRFFEYRVTLFGQDAAKFENNLYGWQNRTFAFPVWTDKVSVTAAVAPGDSYIPLSNTSLASFEAGSLATLLADDGSFEAVLVDAVDAGGISIVGLMQNAWAAGTRVYPTVTGQLPTSVPVERLTGQVLTATLPITTDPVTTPAFLPAAAAPVTYNGYEVLTTQPDWARPVSNEYQYAKDVIDGMTGAIDWMTTEEFPRIVRRYSWLLSSRQAIKDFRAFLARRKGATKPFYAPTWAQDFVVATGTVDPGQMFLVVRDNAFYDRVGVNTTRDRLLIRMRSGQTFYRRIASVTDAGGGLTNLGLDSALGIAYDAGDVKDVHLLQLCRLATDRVDLEWFTDAVVRVETNLITVKA